MTLANRFVTMADFLLGILMISRSLVFLSTSVAIALPCFWPIIKLPSQYPTFKRLMTDLGLKLKYPYFHDPHGVKIYEGGGQFYYRTLYIGTGREEETNGIPSYFMTLEINVGNFRSPGPKFISLSVSSKLGSPIKPGKDSFQPSSLWIRIHQSGAISRSQATSYPMLFLIR